MSPAAVGKRSGLQGESCDLIPAPRVDAAASLARDVGVTQPTARAWLGVLEAAYIVKLAPPFLHNLGQRAIKAPKAFFLDSGLLCALTRQPSGEAALAGAMGGAIFEGLMFAEAVKAFAAAGVAADVFHWRSREGLEIDHVLALGGRLVPVEVKLTGTPTVRHADSLRRFRAVGGDDAEPGLFVCRVRRARELPGGVIALPWQEFPEWLWRRLSTSLRPARRAPGRAQVRPA